MHIKEIAELIQIIEGSAIEEFELEKSGVRIRIRKSSPGGTPGPRGQLEIMGSSSQEMSAEAERAGQNREEKSSIYVFKAPIVGTFYITPKPDAEPFVRVGDRVSKGSVLCIVEAMKIFNQIESDVEGEIVRVLVENGQPVEYGEALFEINLS